MPNTRSTATGLLYIAAFKLLKAILLLATALGALRLLHQDVASVAIHWVNALRVDPGNRYIHRLLASLSNVDDQRLRELSIGTFIYSALSFTEGIGLALRKRWAEYFTTIITTSFVPLEVWEIYHNFRVAKIVVLLINIAVVVYLVWELRRSHARST